MMGDGRMANIASSRLDRLWNIAGAGTVCESMLIMVDDECADGAQPVAEMVAGARCCSALK